MILSARSLIRTDCHVFLIRCSTLLLSTDLLHQRLFELDPSLETLFKAERSQQGLKLMAILSRVVASLDNLTDVMPALQVLGRRHGTGMSDYENCLYDVCVCVCEIHKERYVTDRYYTQLHMV